MLNVVPRRRHNESEGIGCTDVPDSDEKLGSEDKVKSSGRLAVKGRDYVVEDGDILFIRFSV